MALDVNVHPIVLMNISDHFTRVKAQSGNARRVIGALLGTQSGRQINVLNSCELDYAQTAAGVVIDSEFVERRLELFSQVFPNFDFLGWYSTGDKRDEDIEIHRKFGKYNENPLYLVLHTNAQRTVSEKLPMDLYESVIQVNQAATTLQFKLVDYRIETTDSERISVDYVAKQGKSTGFMSEYGSNLSSLSNAVKMLQTRLEALIRVVQSNPGLQRNRKLMRKLQALCNLIPTPTSPQFGSDFYKEYSESLLTTLLSSLTKSEFLLNELADKMEGATSRHRSLI